MLRTRVLALLDECDRRGEDGLLRHLLRLLLRDLGAPAGELDARYHARQLTLAADRLDR